MALPTNRIYLRSPYFVSKDRADLRKIVVELYIYTGTLTTDKPATYQYRLYSDAYPISSGNYYAEIDIAEKARDYVEVAYSGSTVSSAVWIEYDLYYADDGDTALTLDSSVTLTGLDGYGYFEDGYNPSLTDNVLLSTDYVIAPTGQGIDIPCLQDNLDRFILARGGLQLYNSGPLTTTENTANVVYYADTGLGITADRCIFKFNGGIADKVVNIRYIDECKNENVRVTFVNKFGAIQNMYFFGRMKKTMNTTDSKYKRNLLTNGSYDTKRHQNTILTKNATDTITINTGYYPEDSNVTFTELFMSEQVWITFSSVNVGGDKFNIDDSQVYPVNVRSTALQYKDGIYDKLINYQVDFEIANSKINNVR